MTKSSQDSAQKKVCNKIADFVSLKS